MAYDMLTDWRIPLNIVNLEVITTYPPLNRVVVVTGRKSEVLVPTLLGKGLANCWRLFSNLAHFWTCGSSKFGRVPFGDHWGQHSKKERTPGKILWFSNPCIRINNYRNRKEIHIWFVHTVYRKSWQLRGLWRLKTKSLNLHFYDLMLPSLPFTKRHFPRMVFYLFIYSFINPHPAKHTIAR